jgi:hypothetical protein
VSDRSTVERLTPETIVREDYCMRDQLLKKVTSLVLVIAAIAVSVTTVFALDPKGRPKGMGPNAASGYYIWQDERGWHLRTISGSEKHRFSGEIINEGGSFDTVKQYREEPGTWFKHQGNKITIDLSAGKNIDGIDFQSTGGSLTFRLSIDDREEPSAIWVGANAENPSGIPFTLR